MSKLPPAGTSSAQSSLSKEKEKSSTEVTDAATTSPFNQPGVPPVVNHITVPVTAAKPASSKRMLQPTTDRKDNKKSPYRRTKRPKNYNDKSTITTTTPAVAQQNAYDAVLAESQDLWQAAAEAQQLGRLKIASAYMLLLHARLVGLGKRFDKHHPTIGNNKQPPAEEAKEELHSYDHDSGQKRASRRTGTTTKKEMTPSSRVSTRSTAVATSPPGAVPPPNFTSPFNMPSGFPTPKTQAARQFAKMLPSNIELDTAMMEHLAKAAAELHAARSGRKREPSVLQSPDAREFLAGTANRQGVTTATTLGVAWTRSEIDCMEVGLLNGKTPRMIAKQMGRTVQQVRSFFRNRDERARVAADLDLPPATDESPNSKRKGGRGRKPATTAMNTVPNAICDARTLLQGGCLKERTSDDSSQDEVASS